MKFLQREKSVNNLGLTPNAPFVGFFFLAILWVLNAVFVIIASIQASDGKFYRYPMTIRFIQ